MSHLEGTLRKADIAHSWHSVPRRPWVGEHARGGPEMKGELYGEVLVTGYLPLKPTVIKMSVITEVSIERNMGSREGLDFPLKWKRFPQKILTLTTSVLLDSIITWPA